MFNFLLKNNIKGKNNKIVYVSSKKERKITFVRKNSSIKIKGNNNTVLFYSNTKSLRIPRGLNLNIIGNNNTVVIHEPNFENSTIDIYGKNCNFTLGKQKIQKVKSAFFGIGHGASVIIGENCELGNGGLHIVANGDHKEKHKLVIGNRVNIAKDAIIRTSDGHTLCDENWKPFGGPQDVIIEDDVWIMSRVIILKGTHISKGSAVAANALVNKKFKEENILIAGLPAKILKKNIRWAFDYYGRYMEKFENQEK